ncbi:MAG: menaquinone biosynthesis protein [Sphingomonadales bacterium]|nr:menaquinone biosynthesis protein [Sphingomonadales bacterium]
MKKIRVGIVNYLNTRPLLYGLEQADFLPEMELTGNYPAAVASQLIGGDLDLALVPVAIIPTLPTHFIVGNHCIATDYEVASVCVCSQVPIREVDSILLDYQSKTSIALLQILLRYHWRLNPRLSLTKSDSFIAEIVDRQAGLIIGDRALEVRSKYHHVYDLGVAWHMFTGLPFVFATWISTQKLPPSFIARFDAANALGVRSIDKVIQQVGKNSSYDLDTYFRKNISYQLTDKKNQAITSFLDFLR